MAGMRRRPRKCPVGWIALFRREEDYAAREGIRMAAHGVGIEQDAWRRTTGQPILVYDKVGLENY